MTVVWVSYILGAPEFVNQVLRASCSPTASPSATPLVGKREGSVNGQHRPAAARADTGRTVNIKENPRTCVHP